MRLTLHGALATARREEISVEQKGVPIPYGWNDDGTIEVNDVFESASIRFTPKPLNSRGDKMTCQKLLMNEGKPYPRTCEECGLGPCKRGLAGLRPTTDMDDIIERAKNLGRMMGMLDIKIIVLDRYAKHIAASSSDADEDRVIINMIDAEIQNIEAIRK